MAAPRAATTPCARLEDRFSPNRPVCPPTLTGTTYAARSPARMLGSKTGVCYSHPQCPTNQRRCVNMDIYTQIEGKLNEMTQRMTKEAR